MAKSRYLSDENGDKFYPCAHASATYDNNGKTVEFRLNEIENDIELTDQNINDIYESIIESDNTEITNEDIDDLFV